MSNRRRAQRSRGFRQSPLFGQDAEPGIDFALAQLFRRECPDCEWAVLRWFVGSEAAADLGLGAAAALLRHLPVEDHRTAECWQCARCGAAGAFGPAEWEML